MNSGNNGTEWLYNVLQNAVSNYYLSEWHISYLDEWSESHLHYPSPRSASLLYCFILLSSLPPPRLPTPSYINSALFFLKGPVSNKNKRNEWVWKRDCSRVGAVKRKGGGGSETEESALSTLRTSGRHKPAWVPVFAPTSTTLCAHTVLCLPVFQSNHQTIRPPTCRLRIAPAVSSPHFKSHTFILIFYCNPNPNLWPWP